MLPNAVLFSMKQSFDELYH